MGTVCWSSIGAVQGMGAQQGSNLLGTDGGAEAMVEQEEGDCTRALIFGAVWGSPQPTHS